MAIAIVRLFFALALGFMAMPFAAEAQQAPKIARVGVLWPVSDDTTLEGFRRGLREFGYVEGRNVVLEYRYADGKDELLPGLAAELVHRNVDVIVTWGVGAAHAAQQATKTIPIVNGSMSDPVRAGLVHSLARPGGNLTGLTSSTPELSAKRLELIRDIVPRLSRVAALATANPTAVFGLNETETAARSLGLTLLAAQVRDRDAFDDAFTDLTRQRVDALVVLADMLFIQHRQAVVDRASQHRIPTVFAAREDVAAGGLMSYSVSFPDMFRRAAGYVDRILKGAKPADLPIERPTKFELVINRKTAASLGLAIPKALLERADEVIE